MTPLAIIILAAGKGTRMRSDFPKALQPICGRSMLDHLLDKAVLLKAKKTIVIAGHQIDKVRKAVGGRALIAHQKKLLGSGHAVYQAANMLKGFKGSVLVLYCDTPLISLGTLQKLFENHCRQTSDCSFLSTLMDRPEGYGRIGRDSSGRVTSIIEETDLNEGEKSIQEVNVGCYVFKKELLFDALEKIRRNPKKKEYYLTDVIALLAQNAKVEAVQSNDPEEVMGVNTLKDLAKAEQALQRLLVSSWIAKGVRIRDPHSTIIDAGVEIGHDTILLPGTVIEDQCIIGERCVIGPFARIRGASKVGDGCVIGNFVEIVRSQIGPHTQIKHLSYLGDAKIGASVNIGAGAITANFDGKKKHETVIKDNAIIGSGTILVAPVTIGRGAKTGAGAVVTKGKNVRDGEVVIGIPAKRLGDIAK